MTTPHYRPFDHEWSPKSLREKLCTQQRFAPDLATSDAIQALIEILDEHRPVGPDGKHGTRHTPTCGCEDTVEIERRSLTGYEVVEPVDRACAAPGEHHPKCVCNYSMNPWLRPDPDELDPVIDRRECGMSWLARIARWFRREG